MKERITVIEPQSLIKKHVERMINDLGYLVIAQDNQPDLAIVAVGTTDFAYETHALSWLQAENIPIIVTAYNERNLNSVGKYSSVFTSLIRPFNRAKLAAAIRTVGGKTDIDSSDISIATESGSIVVDDEQVVDISIVGEEDLLFERPMKSLGPDSAMIKTFAPALVGAAELIANELGALCKIPRGSARNEAVLTLLLQAGIVAIDEDEE